jgi:hypothetical protein
MPVKTVVPLLPMFVPDSLRSPDTGRIQAVERETSRRVGGVVTAGAVLVQHIRSWRAGGTRIPVALIRRHRSAQQTRDGRREFCRAANSSSAQRASKGHISAPLL